MDKQGLLDIYEMFGWIAIGAAVVVLLLSPIVKKWMHLDTLEDRDPGDDLEGQRQAGLDNQVAGMHPATDPPGPGDEPQGDVNPATRPQ
jgi:POT family proton-dependent oligopeptide transporter